jgi:hypothetical protein
LDIVSIQFSTADIAVVAPLQRPLRRWRCSATAERHGRCAVCCQVVSLVGVSSAATDDSHSSRVAALALAAVVPAWLAAGRDAAALVRGVVETLPRVPQHRRLGLLAALLAVLPEASAFVGGALSGNSRR